MDLGVLFALSLTLFAGLATGAGSIIALFAKTTNTKFLAGSLGFSAGVMIYVSMIEIFQKSRTYLAMDLGDNMGYYVAVLSFFAGIVFIGLIDYFVPSAEGDIGNLKDDRSDALKRMGLMTALAIAIHNFPDEYVALMLFLPFLQFYYLFCFNKRIPRCFLNKQITAFFIQMLKLLFVYVVFVFILCRYFSLFKYDYFLK